MKLGVLWLLAGALLLAQPADLILYHGKVWTGNGTATTIQSIATQGSEIIGVGPDQAVLPLRGPKTRFIDLHERLVVPGFNDAHTHFENAVEWFFQALVMNVSNEAELLEHLRPVVARVPPVYWITGTDWSAIPAWTAERRHTLYKPFLPRLADVDAVAPHHPVLLRRYDKVYFANSRALELARIAKNTPDPLGGHYGKDEKTGELNGVLLGTAGEMVEKMIPPMNAAQKRIGALGVQAEFHRYGITSIHDIARLDAVSEEQTYSTYAERSYSDVGIFQDLERRGELSLRVYALLPLQSWANLAAQGIRPGAGDDWIRYGALKDFEDGTLMLAPWSNRPDYSGNWTFRFPGEQQMKRNIVEADRAGYDIGVHVIGDRALDLLLDWYETAARQNGPRDRRFRAIHAWFATPEDIERAGRLHVIADVTPSQLSHDPQAIERIAGPVRAKTAFAWKDMLGAGVKLDLVSDMPGLYNKQDVSPFDPLVNMHDAVTRTWHPEQAITVEEALAAYTLNPAFASREEKRKGVIETGKFADLVVLSEDILNDSPESLLSAKVLYTIAGGKIVYQGNP